MQYGCGHQPEGKHHVRNQQTPAFADNGHDIGGQHGRFARFRRFRDQRALSRSRRQGARPQLQQLRLHLGESPELAIGSFGVAEEGGVGHVRPDRKAVDGDPGPLSRVDCALAPDRTIGHQPATVAGLYDGERTAQSFDLGQPVEDLGLDFRRQRFNEIGAAQRIDDVGEPVLAGDDLERTQRDPH